MHVEKYQCQVYDFLKKELHIENPNDHPGIQAFFYDKDIFKIMENKNLTFPHTYWFMASKKFVENLIAYAHCMMAPLSYETYETL